MIKIIFFDIDGTLIDYNKKDMSDKVKYALKKVKEQGILTFIATGRPPYIVPDFSDFQFDGMITFNGQLCFFNNTVIYKKVLDKTDAKRIIENAKKLNKGCMIAGKDRMGGNIFDSDLDHYMKFATPQGQNIISDFNTLFNEDLFQMMVAVTKKEEELLFQNVNNTVSARWFENGIDIIPKNGGKGNAIENVLNYFDLKKEECMAIGDGGNDFDMIQASGIGIAMGNAKDELKKIADHVTKTASEDGVYYALKYFDLI